MSKITGPKGTLVDTTVAMRKLRCTRATVVRMLSTGRLDGIRIAGRVWLIYAKSIDEAVTSLSWRAGLPHGSKKPR